MIQQQVNKEMVGLKSKMFFYLHDKDTAEKVTKNGRLILGHLLKQVKNIESN
jgi:hypothetical protein